MDYLIICVHLLLWDSHSLEVVLPAALWWSQASRQSAAAGCGCPSWARGCSQQWAAGGGGGALWYAVPQPEK